MTLPSVVAHWRALCGLPTGPAATDALHLWLSHAAAGLPGDEHAKATAVGDVLLHFRGRRLRLLEAAAAQAGAGPGGLDPAFLPGLAHVLTTPAELADALGRPLTGEEAAALEAATPATESRLTGLARKALARQLLSGLRRERAGGLRHAPRPAAHGSGERAAPPTGAPPQILPIDDDSLRGNRAFAVGADDAHLDLHRATAALEAAERRWSAGETQAAFAAWRAEGRGEFAGNPTRVLEVLSALEACAAGGPPFQSDSDRRTAHRLRAALTTIDPATLSPGARLSWPLDRLAGGEAPLTVHADAQVATDRTRARNGPAPSVRTPPARRP